MAKLLLRNPWPDRTRSVALACASAAFGALVSASTPAQAQTPPGLLFQGELGVPKFKSEAGPSVAGSAKLGYGWSHFGLDGYASHLVEDTDDDNGDLVEVLRTSFGASAWYASGSASTWRFEARAEGYALFYSSSSFSTAPTAVDQLSEFTRFTLFGGLRSPQESDLTVGILAGLGPQFESHSSHTTEQSGQSTYDESFTYRLRGDLRYRVVPDKVVVRARTDISYYSLSRSVYTAGEGVINSSQHGVDALNRAYLDVVAWSFIGLVPGIFAGVDVFVRSGSGAKSSVVPIGGLALTTPF
ncbi:MAG: hypothetical protein HY898_23915 [Deltaproteobacteria bacterium]|nr:hypothetical protein [Deltaproteobacteria bacterium]